jgi:hypothetical protein
VGYPGDVRGADWDHLDEELFSERLDFRAARPDPYGDAVTVRLEERGPVPYAYAPGGVYVPTGYLFGGSREDDRTYSARDPLLGIALAGLLVIVLISTGVVLWWFS